MEQIPKCSIEGCNNNRKGTGKDKNGNKRYSKLCSSHHNIKYGIPNWSSKKKRKFRDFGNWKEIEKISKEPCVRCGWNKSYCDRHRIVKGEDGGKYTKENVISLCPNCHRIEHFKF